MREKFFINFIFLLLLILNVTAQERGGVLRFANQNIDLETVHAENEYHITIPVVNIGNSSVNVLKIDTDCGCSNASINNETIAIGDTAFFTINFTPVEGETPFYRNIVIQTDAKISQYTVVLQGVLSPFSKEKNLNEIIVPWKSYHKSYPIFSNYIFQVRSKKGDEINLPIYLTNVGEKTLHVEEISSSTLDVEEVKLPRSVLKGEVLFFPITAKVKDENQYRHYLKVKTDERSILIRIHTSFIE
ncbi:DUF1573 domain-containing protein [Flammeovirga sp. MY04]|uniref:DUF1573 domain-containing protein n=1 Tax=Flammeovirga sp. MY04 TaxID=1191459 RepID=UPI0008061BD3|nr:DUF1573 domain-containing protein [Flammeovirga sp. MY04]ANQ48928.1 DUF1573 domain-containing protein [Flammeovirga sp. MY04]